MDAATEWFSDLPDFETLLFDLLDAIGHGFAVGAMGWKQAEKILRLCAFYKRPQRWFQTAAHDRNAIRLIDGSIDGAELNPFGWLLHRHQAKNGWVAESGIPAARDDEPLLQPPGSLPPFTGVNLMPERWPCMTALSVAYMPTATEQVLAMSVTQAMQTMLTPLVTSLQQLIAPAIFMAHVQGRLNER